MIWTILGSLLVLLGAPFFVRGMIFSLKPEHSISLRARERNLRVGLETDMRRWGRRVRRFGAVLLLLGAGLLYLGLR